MPHDFNVVIEIPMNADPVKYEVDKDTGAVFVDRFMLTAMHYPCNYGYIPQTLSDDGDPVDVLIMTPFPIRVGAVVCCRALGLLKMEDEAGGDAKLLAVPVDKLYPAYSKLRSPVRTRFCHQSRGHQFLPRTVRRAASGAAARPVHSTGRTGYREHSGRSRGLRFRQPLRHGGRSLRTVFLHYRRVSEYARRVLAGSPRPLAGDPARPRIPPEWLEVAELLDEAGKDVVLSTQVLLESGVELNTMRKVVDNGRYSIEANDMGAVRYLKGRPFVAGPYLNIYSKPTLDVLAAAGATRWVMPLEMGREGLQQLQHDRPAGVQTEVFAFGRMSLAYSARCFTARNRNLPKDNGQYVCMDHPDGLLMQTRESQNFLTINGIQTQSASVHTLIHELEELAGMGVDVIRFSPQSQYMEEVVRSFKAVMEGGESAAAAHARLEPRMPAAPCNGYWYGRPGLDMVQPQTEGAR